MHHASLFIFVCSINDCRCADITNLIDPLDAEEPDEKYGLIWEKPIQVIPAFSAQT